MCVLVKTGATPGTAQPSVRISSRTLGTVDGTLGLREHHSDGKRAKRGCASLHAGRLSPVRGHHAGLVSRNALRPRIVAKAA
ncbi:MAG: hypothetical protein QOJ99_4613 [Bryobacterales bacterium]|jgi:hypothetical protein|nr:hypothetical protein [Bryobacterales bacterium]